MHPELSPSPPDVHRVIAQPDRVRCGRGGVTTLELRLHPESVSTTARTDQPRRKPCVTCSGRIILLNRGRGECASRLVLDYHTQMRRYRRTAVKLPRTPRGIGRHALGAVFVAVGAACATPAEPSASLPWDSTLPPIDAPALPGRPATYKGLPLILTTTGTPALSPVRGVVGVVCIGMSNADEECAAYRSRVAGAWASEVNPAVRIVNCAVGGYAIERWNDTTFDALLWDACKSSQIPASGVALDQVLVIYHKAANQFTTAAGAPLPLYPDPASDYHAFHRNLSRFAARVREEFPAVRAVYTTSRSYGGYAPTAARGEPLSYEEGHALNRWLAEHPSVDGVWQGWGPYIWAPDCASGITNGSGICYTREDYVADGVHPSPLGEAKIAGMLHARFRKESWYRP